MASPAQKFSFQHAGTTLCGYHWPATTSGNGVAIGIIHGLGEYAGRYDDVAAYYNKLGYDVFGYDHEGHGESLGARGTIRSWTSFLGGINSFIHAIEQTADSAPQLVLYGHSMGGLLLLDYLVSRPEAHRLAAATVTAPALQLSKPPSVLLQKLAGLAERIAPDVTKANGLEQAALSRDAGVVSYYSIDPLVHDRVSMRLGAQLLAVPKRLLAGPVEIPVPLLLMHGTADRITHPNGSQAFSELAQGDVSLRLWQDHYHELHNEPTKEEVFDYTSAWLASKLNVQ